MKPGALFSVSAAFRRFWPPLLALALLTLSALVTPGTWADAVGRPQKGAELFVPQMVREVNSVWVRTSILMRK